ncbi:serine/threonine-protein kinase [Sphaerisporangium sp. TRM90804]|uniref:serine/threonine protein kinase n=1 Tax=Sphaerisporangium sp. TRM90804 TaxID=3031113 RepID=UPI0024471E8A|nr:serine/threonine-protein kinase [Sphaerisporangium sp. TRM90804]MDH2430167.1 protein kinase [Sphaerisporangium sp. TRM90804]
MTGRIGEGGQGVVYAGETGSGATVAVKLLHPRFYEDAHARRTFGVELRRAQRVTDRHVARILAYGVHDRHLYYVGEYVDGPSLGEVVERRGPLPAQEMAGLAVATLTALAAVHGSGAVHGDFRPGCVLLGPDGPRVIDFGVVRALDGRPAAGRVIGTSPFTAPEHLAGTAPGPESDMFAWAGTMVYAATGRPPFGQDSVPAVINRILNGLPDVSALSGTLLRAVTACLDKTPAGRPSARDALAILQGGATGGPAAVPAPGPDAAPPPASIAAWQAAPPARPAAGPPPYEGPVPPAPRPRSPASPQAGPLVAPSLTATAATPASRMEAAPAAGAASWERSQATGPASGPANPRPDTPVAGRPGGAAGPGRPEERRGEPGRREPLSPGPAAFAGAEPPRHRHRGRHTRAVVIAGAAIVLAAVVAVALVVIPGDPAGTPDPGAAPLPVPVPPVTSAAPSPTPTPGVGADPTTEPTPVPSPSPEKTEPTRTPPASRPPSTPPPRPVLLVSPNSVRVKSDYIFHVNIKLRAPGGAVRWRASITEGGVLSSTHGRIRAGSSATITAYGTPYCSTSRVRFTSNGGGKTVTIAWGGVLC